MCSRHRHATIVEQLEVPAAFGAGAGEDTVEPFFAGQAQFHQPPPITGVDEHVASGVRTDDVEDAVVVHVDQPYGALDGARPGEDGPNVLTGFA